MKAFIVILAVLMALVGAASADTVGINGNYVWNGGTAIVGTNLLPGVTFASGMNLNSNPATLAAGDYAAQSTIANTMTLGVAQNPQTMVAIVSAKQSGANSVTVNNGQEPGSLDPAIWDFQSTDSSGGQVTAASEGMGSGSLTNGGDTASTFHAASTDTDSSYGFLLNHNVVATDYNVANGAVVIDPITVPGTTTSGTTVVTDHVQQDIPTSGDSNVPDCHIKDTTYSWNCVGGVDVKYEDCYNKDTIVTSGISAGAAAIGEVSPLANGLVGATGIATSAFTVSENGAQNIAVQTSNYGTT